MSLVKNRLAGLYQKQQLLGILVFSMVTIVVWVAISLVTSQTNTSIPPELLKLATPLSPTLNKDVLDQIEEKRVYTPDELAVFPIYKVLTTKNARQSASTSGIARTSSLGNLTAVEVPATELEEEVASDSTSRSEPELTPTPIPSQTPDNSDSSVENETTDEL